MVAGLQSRASVEQPHSGHVVTLQQLISAGPWGYCCNNQAEKKQTLTPTASLLLGRDNVEFDECVATENSNCLRVLQRCVTIVHHGSIIQHHGAPWCTMVTMVYWIIAMVYHFAQGGKNKSIMVGLIQRCDNMIHHGALNSRYGISFSTGW